MKGKNCIKKVFISIFVCIFSCFSFSGCFDLGNFSNEGEQTDGFDYSSYYNTFGEVVGLYRKGYDEDGIPFGDKAYYDVEDSLLNKTTAEQGSWEKSDYVVDTQEYVYIAIPIKKDFKMGNFALCLRADKIEYQNAKMDVNVYLLSEDEDLPQNICYAGSPTQKIIYDEEHPEGYEEELGYDDPKDKEPIATATVYPVENQWVSFLIKNWIKDGAGSPILEVHSGETLLLQFVGNTGYLSSTERNKCEFSFINLLIYSLKED